MAELESIRNDLSIPRNNVEATEVQDRETWEYVAREFVHRYRFDTVFQADRFGNIYHFIQSGYLADHAASESSISAPSEESEAPDDVTYFTQGAVFL
mmetsp:Transcript_22509/g.46731  ORF Transcript_22509/g.46731 Transcript_22509/m.46731 type:complete len:97 (+) Transcript_22509:434-724(+)